MAEPELGVLIHGAGWVAGEHIKAFQCNPHTRVVASSSRTLAGAQRRARECRLADVGTYSQLERALKHKGVDLRSALRATA